MKADKSNNYLYNKSLKDFARANRKKATKAEACLWKYVLRKGQVQGYTFKRQRPVLNFIADFMCQELNLIIEVDGITHEREEVFIQDIWRQRKLEVAGFTILRFSDEDVLENMDEVRRFVLKTVGEIEATMPPSGTP